MCVRLAAAALLLFLPTFASANHIDFIEDDSVPGNGVTNATFSLSTSGALVTNTQVGEPADILGGSRTVTLTRTGGFGGSISAEKAAGTGFINVLNDTVAAGTLTLSYPGISNSNFSSLWNAIAVDIPYLDQSTGIGDGEINLSVTVTSSAGTGTAFATGTLLAPGRIEEPGTYTFPFNDPGFAGVDFADVDGVSVRFETAIIGSDFQIGEITREQLVPEPATLSLVGVGVMAAGALRRRRAA
jgi:hypothetical protein